MVADGALGCICTCVCVFVCPPAWALGVFAAWQGLLPSRSRMWPHSVCLWSGLRPDHSRPGINQRQGQSRSLLQTLTQTQAPLNAHIHVYTHTHTHIHRHTLSGCMDGSIRSYLPSAPGSIRRLVHACCLHVTLTDSGMNDLFGGGFSIVRDGWHQ